MKSARMRVKMLVPPDTEAILSQDNQVNVASDASGCFVGGSTSNANKLCSSIAFSTSRGQTTHMDIHPFPDNHKYMLKNT